MSNRDQDITYLKTTVPSLQGWCPVEKAIMMYDYASEFNDPICVELGVFAGRSLLALALAAKAKNGRAYGIDAWSKTASAEGVNSKENEDWWSKIDYDYFYKYTQNVIKEAAADSFTTIIRKRSDECVGMFKDQSIHVLHQDSNHSEEITVPEVEMWYNKVIPGGYWIFDDANWETTKKAQNLLLQRGYEEIYSSAGNEYKIYQRVTIV